MSLNHVLEILDNIGAVSARTKKESIIKQSLGVPYFKEVCYLALNPYKRFKTKDIYYIVNAEHDDVKPIKAIFKFLNYLSIRAGATDAEINELSRLASIDKDTVEVVRRIVNKDLRCGASIKTFKKFIPSLPDFELMRCEKDLNKFLKNTDDILISYKYDGVRNSTSGNGIYLSRSGKEFPNFGVFDEEIRQLKINLEYLYPDIDWTDVVFDGEVKTDQGDHDFQKLMTQLRNIKNADPSIFSFYIFDMIVGDFTLRERYNMLEKAMVLTEFDKLKLVHHVDAPVIDKEYFKSLAEDVIAKGYEGLVLKNGNSLYERKRSKEWCKIKQLLTADVKVTGWEYGKDRTKYKDALGKLCCEFKNGKSFKVGSGLSDWQREEFMTDTPKIIEIEYQELTKDGKPRSPIFKRVRDDKNSVD